MELHGRGILLGFHRESSSEAEIFFRSDQAVLGLMRVPVPCFLERCLKSGSSLLSR
jgi:hypothetical protein